MNDRIRGIAEHCDFYVGNEHYNESHEEKQRLWVEKFAELIVRECAEVCMKEIDTGWVMAPKSPWMAKQILEHFGVE